MMLALPAVAGGSEADESPATVSDAAAGALVAGVGASGALSTTSKN